MRTLHAHTAAAVLTALLAVLVLAGPAAASEGHDLPWGDLGWRVVNLIVFVAILWHFGGKIVVNYFRGRRQKIKTDIDDLTGKRDAAKKHLEEVEARIVNLEEEREAILAESRKQAEALKATIVFKARQQAKQIVDAARAAAESEGQAVVAQVRAAIADEVVEATKKTLLSTLDEAGHEALVDRSLEKVVLK